MRSRELRCKSFESEAYASAQNQTAVSTVKGQSAELVLTRQIWHDDRNVWAFNIPERSITEFTATAFSLIKLTISLIRNCA